MRVRYNGTAMVRELSASDIVRSYGILHEDVSVDTRVSREVEVSDELGSRLILDPSWSPLSGVAVNEAAESDREPDVGTTTSETSASETQGTSSSEPGDTGSPSDENKPSAAASKAKSR